MPAFWWAGYARGGHADAFYTWLIAKHGVKAGRAAGVTGALVALLPDAHVGLASLYHGSTHLLGGDVPAGDGMLAAVFSEGFLGVTGSALRPVAPPAGALEVYAAARFGWARWEPRRVLLWFIVGWAA